MFCVLLILFPFENSRLRECKCFVRISVIIIKKMVIVLIRIKHTQHFTFLP